MAAQTDKPVSHIDPQKADLNKRLETIAWGFFLIMLGGFAFVPHGIIHEGLWSIGVGFIMLGLNAARYVNHLRVVALLNSYCGLAAAATGFALGNSILIISGSLDGASGFLLSILMSKAMNRSFSNVLFGAFGGGAPAAALGTGSALPVRAISAEDAAIQLAYASRVIIVPGYGMAVAQAQHQVRELAELIEKRGGEVKYAIHPVAGRMPGHMNVLLAEANVPYDRLYDMEEINGEFADADVALVVGANDVVNPAARNDKSSPIYGMPILNVDQAHSVIVLKRSMNPGFAGIENELFYDEKTSMLFGDAKSSLTKLVSEVKAV
jgi:NAD(P) transhydrogenase subunit beta